VMDRTQVRSVNRITTLRENPLPGFATAWIAILQEKLARQMLIGGFRTSSP